MRDMNHDNKIDSRDHVLFDIANGSSETNRSSGTGSGGGCGPIMFAIIITILLIKSCSP